ncbi:MAG: recombination protein RecA [Elusimicrobia bacterium]|nr:MAG: recombination protein RecA [Elusimicrobiota bacterium]
MGDSHMGLQARLMSQALRKLTSTISRTSTTLIFINQIRHKIGVMFGNPETTTGGLALKFYASVRLDIRRVENLKQGDVVYGARCRVKVVKNKLAPPYRQAMFDMIHGYGISKEGCLVDMGSESGIIEKSGSWFIYNGERIGQGRENAKATLRDNLVLAAAVEKALREKFLVAPGAAGPAVEDAAEEDGPVRPPCRRARGLRPKPTGS